MLLLMRTSLLPSSRRSLRSLNGVDDDAVRTYFSAGKDVYPSVYEFVNTVIRNT